MEGQYANDDATKFVELASKCLQAEARDRPDSKFLLTAVSPLQKQKEVKNICTRKFLYSTVAIQFFISIISNY